MEKNQFIQAFRGEDAHRMAKLYEFLERNQWPGAAEVTDEFYPPPVIQKVLLMKDYPRIQALGEPYFERRALAAGEVDDAPLAILEILNKDKRIALGHGDYLGALMSLGLAREKFGDVFLRDDRAFVVVFAAHAGYFSQELHQVGRCSVETTVLPYGEALSLLQPEMTEKEAVISSLRLDVVVAEIARISRSKALELLQRGQVLLNYQEAREKAKDVHEGDTLTIRGKGKFKIGKILGTTQKGNLRISYAKFE